MEKAIIFSNYGLDGITPEMQEIMKKHFGIRSRMGEIIEYVENHAVMADEFLSEVELLRYLKNDPNAIVCRRPGKEYQVQRQDWIMPSTFSIIEIDTSRPWTIDEYDGAESVKYLDEIDLVDEDLNYYEER